MKKEGKLDFSKAPIMLEIGSEFVFSINKNKTYFFTAITDICNSINSSEGIIVPKIHISKNFELKPLEYRFSIYGKQIEKFVRYSVCTQAKDILSVLISNLERILKANSFYFKDNLKISKEKIEKLKLEQNREAYQQLYRYYSNIELDKKQAFHWLKKMSYYGSLEDLGKLADCYFYGDGCEKDRRQSRKLCDLINPDSRKKWKF